MFPGELKDKPVWRFFRDICGIPHTSGNESALSRYIINFAGERELECSSDSLGNVLVRKPGRGEPVAIQAHIDMVGEKTSSSTHDFLTQPINAEIEGEVLISRETTLGADNGIGVAVMLELLDGEYPGLPPLECVFTVDEERGLIGALGMAPEWIQAERLINLDSEELGVLIIGCAGGRDVMITLEGRFEEYSGTGVEITVDGLNGGHSGMEIGSENANAIKLAARICHQLREAMNGRLVRFTGGTKHNAIPRQASAVLSVDDPVRARTLCSLIRKDLAEEYAGIEESISVKCRECSVDKRLTGDSSSSMIDLLLALPHGVEKMSGVVDDLVETSCNLAIASWREDSLEILLSVRSALESAKNALTDSITAGGRLAGGRCVPGKGYPGWAPDTSSELLEKAGESCREILGMEPSIEAIHAGLECGIIGQRAGDLDMISLGPDINDVHVPGESVRIESVDLFLAFLVNLLESL